MKFCIGRVRKQISRFFEKAWPKTARWHNLQYHTTNYEVVQPSSECVCDALSNPVVALTFCAKDPFRTSASKTPGINGLWILRGSEPKWVREANSKKKVCFDLHFDLCFYPCHMKVKARSASIYVSIYVLYSRKQTRTPNKEVNYTFEFFRNMVMLRGCV